MAKLSPEDVLKLARLARINLTEDELKEFTGEFDAILGYIEKLQSVDVDGLEPTIQVSGQTNVMRADTVVDYGYKPADLLRNVPTVQGDQIKVKRMVG
jgi:aspartyl-tRNA(Asn)/glutamyl-tRNA(Gln) amidotransferase subunit C